MTLSEEDTKALLKRVAQARDDALDCDKCFEHLAEFVELELAGSEIPDALIAVKRHIEQCPCCKDEHSALLEALSELGDS